MKFAAHLFKADFCKDGFAFGFRLELDDAGFEASVLTESRLRLIENEDARILFEKLLTKIKAAGLVKARGRQRTHSTGVLGAVRDLNRLECVWEAIRATLNEPAQIAPACFDRYARRPEGFRWSEAEREAVFAEIGNDGWQLLEEINRTETTAVADTDKEALPNIQAQLSANDLLPETQFSMPDM